MSLSARKWSFKRIFPHILFWGFYVLFFGLFYGKYGKDYRLHLIETGCMLPFVMLATYTTIYILLPYYLRTRKLGIAIVGVISVAILVTLGERIFLRWLNGLPVTGETIMGVPWLYLMLETNFMVGIAFAIKFCKIWFDDQQQKHDTEKQNMQRELNALKAQLHPHFLFNTMNNLYALSIEKSSKTSEGIAKISQLLRSVLYECNQNEIELEKELDLLKNYIELEKMRYDDKLRIKFEANGPLEKVKIAPMLLFTFIENCFKHGCCNNTEKPYISMQVKVADDASDFCFVAKNSKPKQKPSEQPDKAGGIGLVNVRKRLELLYPGRYQLNCWEDNDSYQVALNIKIINEQVTV